MVFHYGVICRLSTSISILSTLLAAVFNDFSIPEIFALNEPVSSVGGFEVYGAGSGGFDVAQPTKNNKKTKLKHLNIITAGLVLLVRSAVAL